MNITRFAAVFAIAHYLITGEPTSTAKIIFISALVIYELGRETAS